MMFKEIFLIMIILSLVSGCSTGVRFDPVSFFKGKKPEKVCEDYQLLSETDAHVRLNADIYMFQQNVERSLVYREKVAKSLEDINKYLYRKRRAFFSSND